ncbi:golgin subfamily A member 6-like protein 22 [Bolinopsis microptera]|uniref:golgin subfamily A member 6-like protein 22 n=1 Tax=Bolinopsis microptera TaxID=2820187 RepID=UPI00307B0005
MENERITVEIEDQMEGIWSDGKESVKDSVGEGNSLCQLSQEAQDGEEVSEKSKDEEKETVKDSVDEGNSLCQLSQVAQDGEEVSEKSKDEEKETVKDSVGKGNSLCQLSQVAQVGEEESEKSKDEETERSSSWKRKVTDKLEVLLKEGPIKVTLDEMRRMNKQVRDSLIADNISTEERKKWDVLWEFLGLFVTIVDPWGAMLTWDACSGQDRYKENFFMILNPGRSFNSSRTEDSRYSGLKSVIPMKYGISRGHLENYKQNRINGIPLKPKPGNVEQLMQSGSKNKEVVQVTRGFEEKRGVDRTAGGIAHWERERQEDDRKDEENRRRRDRDAREEAERRRRRNLAERREMVQQRLAEEGNRHRRQQEWKAQPERQYYNARDRRRGTERWHGDNRRDGDAREREEAAERQRLRNLEERKEEERRAVEKEERRRRQEEQREAERRRIERKEEERRAAEEEDRQRRQYEQREAERRRIEVQEEKRRTEEIKRIKEEEECRREELRVEMMRKQQEVMRKETEERCRERQKENIRIQLSKILRQIGERGLYLGDLPESIDGWSKHIGARSTIRPEPVFMGRLKEAKVEGAEMDFNAATLPEGIPSKARQQVSEIISTELGVFVGDKEDFIRVLNRLALRVELTAKDVCYGITEEDRAVVEWKRDDKRKERKKMLEFYIKNRAGEFSRGCRSLVDIVRELWEDEEDMTDGLVEEELGELMRRLWFLNNLDVAI